MRSEVMKNVRMKSSVTFDRVQHLVRVPVSAYRTTFDVSGARLVLALLATGSG